MSHVSSAETLAHSIGGIAIQPGVMRLDDCQVEISEPDIDIKADGRQLTLQSHDVATIEGTGFTWTNPTTQSKHFRQAQAN
jgi:hypothetical protein